ncbi:MAG: PH domain-containing protein [Caldilineaceae bacterium]|nr:PH domain-containing protein [Caldilineaceae bacterium]HRJ43422.1 PH domain-containing protein [Caldilineaceae bacterium]
MDQQEVRKVVASQFYQSVADSGVAITAIPQAQLQALVNGLADGVFGALSSVEAEGDRAIAPAAALPDDDPGAAETLLWSGRPYLSIGIRYELTSQRLRVIRGLLGRSIEEVELVRVRDTTVRQHMGERALNVGDVTVISNDPSNPEYTLNNITNPSDVRELIRRATMAEKQRRGLSYREEM